MTADVVTFVALVVLFFAYDRWAAGGRRMGATRLRPPRAKPIDLARRRAGSRHERLDRTVRDARAL